MNNSNDKINFLFYTGKDGNTNIQVFVDREKETIWASQKGMAEIFEVQVPAISKHLKNIFEDNELDENVVVSKMETTTQHGAISDKTQTKETKFYNLDAIISVGYRINSQRATAFRIWATKVLKEYMIKGFAIDDQRLKQGKEYFGKDYFDELLEKIREIRASERRFYQKITDIYAQCSTDYDPHSKITKTFYATVQNKLHFAIHKSTAAELIYTRASSSKPNMGLTSYKNEPTGGKILKSDAIIAKNYLSKEELTSMNDIVSMYLDYAENQAKRHKVMTMSDWVEKLDAFLSFNEYSILKNPGKISAAIAKRFAEDEYAKFRVIQDKEYKSDFDELINKAKLKNRESN